MKTRFWMGLFATVLLFASSSAFTSDEEKTYQGITYACTGVGESKEDPKWKTYPLKLMFTAGTRAYVSEVKVKIQDGSGQTVLDVNCDAPWLLARLKPGSYSVTAQADGGGAKSVKVTVPAAGQNELAIRFPEIYVESQPGY
jgi:hypothetical protein